MIDVFYMMLLALPMACFGYLIGFNRGKKIDNDPAIYGRWDVINDTPAYQCRCVAMPIKESHDHCHPLPTPSERRTRNHRGGMDFSDINEAVRRAKHSLNKAQNDTAEEASK